LGVSRATWQIGSHYWLSQAEQSRYAEISQQAELLWELGRYLRKECSSIFVPEIVLSDGGRLVEVDGGYAWCLTRNLAGFHPDVSDPGIYSALGEGLAGFHLALRPFSEHHAASVSDGICVSVRQNIARLGSETFSPFTSDPNEREVLLQAGAWILPRLDRFERLPRQIVHGDWTPRNVLFDRKDLSNGLTGVLDFEAMAIDPVCADLASICSTLLMWSGLDRVDERIAGVLDTYERYAGVHVELSDIHSAMLAHWLSHYWRWRDRLQFGEFGHEVKDRLCLRISSVLSYVSTGSGE
jgi:Ser/Thr protein kinase RdoA (MazF antagonist)